MKHNNTSVFNRLSHTLLTISILTAFTFQVKAQNPIELMNAELRHLFSNLNNPNPDVRFLYDMSAKVTDSIFYTDISYDTSIVDNWYNLYYEMYNAAYDTTLFITQDSIFQYSFPKVLNDTIPIGILHWKYNKLKPGALDTNLYFSFDTINNVVYDLVPQPITPYVIESIFAASPLTREVTFANLTFQVTPDLFFTDPTTIYDPDNRILKIDFDDGNGWVEFDPYIVTNHSVIYGSAGWKLIKTAVFDPGGNLLNYSNSVINILTTTVTVPPDDVITDIEGLDIGIYDNNCNPNAMKKYVIYLEGADILENRHVPEIYNGMIRNANIAQLRNFGYTFVVVSWQNSGDSIQANARRVAELLEYLKCQTDSVAPFVIIGESMGGLVARYTTALMESPEYFNLFLDPCKPDLRHNTRLLLCYDSPHRGANVPLGVQMYYKHLAHLAYMFSGFNNGIANIYNSRLLNSISSKQMLVYHIETENNPLLLINSSTFTASSLRAGLLNDFAALGNYPKFCKLGTLSNGALDGSRQTREWDNSDRQPNDFILDLETDFYLKVLGFRFLGSYTQVQVRTNPNGTGSVFLLDKGISHPKIRLRWFGVRIDINHTTLLKVDKRARNVLPYCVSAGSHLGFGNPLSEMNNPIRQSGDLAQLLGLRYNMVINGQGEITFSGNLFSLLVPWMININLNGRAYSDGFDFAFIPLHSSFDYVADNPGNLDYDIYNDAVADIMDRTPFDMVITNPTNSNWHHLEVDNPSLNPYATCNDDAITSNIIPREIGDDSLWLENYRFLPTSMVIEAEQDIMVNYRNPYYNYPSSSSSINNYTHTDRRHYIISKEEDINIPIPAGSTDKITFRANNGVWINPFSSMGPYDIAPGFMVVCCINFSQRLAPPKDSTSDNIQSFMELYPNPVYGSTIINVKYRFKQNAPAKAQLYDIQGRLIDTIIMPFENNTLESGFEIDLNKSNMQTGMYIIQISTKNEVLSKKFVVQP